VKTFRILMILALAACASKKVPDPRLDVPADPPDDAVEITVSELETVKVDHVVRKGDCLRLIADKHGVSWEQVLLANEAFLRRKYDETCASLPSKYRNSRKRKGLFCNDRYRKPYANTLLPGWTLSIPKGKAPAAINEAVLKAGDRIALVIDDTGSMRDDTQRVSQLYLAAMRDNRKKIAGVFLYADGAVRRYKAGSVQFLKSGDRENTYGALCEAAKLSPDAIVLVTDEPGDDWQWPAKGLPPVIAHCIPDRNAAGCESNLQRLARDTGGSYVDLR
jgi:hypothetical protein